MTNVETIVGGTGDDVVTLAARVTGGVIDLGSGDDS